MRRTGKRPINWALVLLFVVLLLTIAGLAFTWSAADTPAWWQAILSASALTLTGLFWHLDKTREVRREEDERRNLMAIVAGSVQELRQQTALLITELDQNQELMTKDVSAMVRRVEHRWLHLQLFSPYDRLGSFSLVNLLADVEVCARALVSLLPEKQWRPPPRPMPTDMAMLAIRRSPEIDVSKVQEAAFELEARCNDAVKALLVG